MPGDKTTIDLTIEPKTVLDQAASRLRTAIMIGELEPGQRLTERYLCERMGISRSSLRTALRRLEAERLITIVPNRGPSVAKLGWSEIEEIHEVWEMLTAEATGRFADIVTDEHIRRLEVQIAAFRAAAKAGDALGHIAATNLFFQVILVGHNRILSEIIVSLMSRINFLRARSMLRKNRGRECAAEMKAIADALKKRNRAAAKAATVHHITQCCNAARDIYEEVMVVA
jgi:DNA-binding GntR family transcriptional regulator